MLGRASPQAFPMAESRFPMRSSRTWNLGLGISLSLRPTVRVSADVVPADRESDLQPGFDQLDGLRFCLSATLVGRTAASGVEERRFRWRPVTAGPPVGGTAVTETVKPNDFLETPWNGSRVRTQSGGSEVSGEKSATACESHTPLPRESRTNVATRVYRPTGMAGDFQRRQVLVAKLAAGPFDTERRIGLRQRQTGQSDGRHAHFRPAHAGACPTLAAHETDQGRVEHQRNRPYTGI